MFKKLICFALGLLYVTLKRYVWVDCGCTSCEVFIQPLYMLLSTKLTIKAITTENQRFVNIYENCNYYYYSVYAYNKRDRKILLIFLPLRQCFPTPAGLQPWLRGFAKLNIIMEHFFKTPLKSKSKLRGEFLKNRSTISQIVRCLLYQ